MSRINLAKYRMKKAEEMLKDAEESLQWNRVSLSINRSYYAMFTAARALLALKELDSSKHSGVIALFNQQIIKLGLFPKKFSRSLSQAKGLREDADYGDFVKITKEDARGQLDSARQFVKQAAKTMEQMAKGLGKS